MKFAAASLLAAVAFSATASVSFAADSIKKFDDATVDAVLAAVGGTVIDKGSSDDGAYRVFTIGELKFVAGQRVCKPETGCLGLLIQCSFNGDTFSTTTANKFNLTHVFSTAAVSEDRKTIYLGRYLIADGGTTLANTIANFKVFFGMPGQLADQVKQEGSAPVASIAPQTTPAAATSATSAATAATAPAASVATEAAPAKAGEWVEGYANILKR